MNTTTALQLQAIKAAQDNRWEDATKLNQEILNQEEENISALNRLGFCYIQLGKPQKAKEQYEHVLELDPYNAIAKKYLVMIGSAKRGTVISSGLHQESFIEEPGKTKTVQLCRVAGTAILASTAIATPCKLVVKNHRIAIETESGTYLGSLPDDLSHHLSKLIKGGNTYKAVVKGVTKTSCTVFLKELSRSKRLTYTTSFPSQPIQHASLSDIHEELLIDQAPLDISETGQEEEPAEDTGHHEEEPETRY